MLPSPPEKKDKRLSFRADGETCEKLDAIAQRLGMKKSDIIRSWIDQTYKELKLDEK